MVHPSTAKLQPQARITMLINRPSLLLAAACCVGAGVCPRLQAQPVPLASTWIEYDLEQEKGQSADGLAILSGQSSSGFTAFIKSNVLNATVVDFPPKSQYLPRIVTTFPDVPITNLGQRVTVSFDVDIHTPIPAANNVGFRMALGDTNANNAVLLGFDWGDAAGQTVLVRYDGTITQNTNWLDPDTFFYLNSPTNKDYAWGSFCDAGANYSTAGLTTGAPNGVSLKPGSTHHFQFSLERTANGLMVGSIWGNSAGPAVISTGGNPIPGGNGDDHNGLTDIRPWRGVNCFGICIFGTGSNPVSWDANGGSYTVSNLKIHAGINITAVQRDPASGDVALTWESHPSDNLNGALYDVQYTTSLSSPNWISLANTNIAPAATYPEGFLTSYTNAAPADPARYYRVQKVYP
jgi:hypothetical protein